MEDRNLDDLISINDLFVGILTEMDLECERTCSDETILEKTPYTITLNGRVITVYRNIVRDLWYYVDDEGKIFNSKDVKTSIIEEACENGEYDEDNLYDYQLYFTDERCLAELLMEPDDNLQRKVREDLRSLYEKIKDNAASLDVSTICDYWELITEIYYMQGGSMDLNKAQNTVSNGQSKIVKFPRQSKQ